MGRTGRSDYSHIFYSSLGATRYTTGTAYSEYGGRLAFGNWLNPDAPQLQAQAASQGVILLASGAVQIIIPDPSPERLQAIAAACDAPPQVVTAITAAADTQAPDAMSALVDTVDALPADAIPPGCAADLRAVAAAMAGR